VIRGGRKTGPANCLAGRCRRSDPKRQADEAWRTGGFTTVVSANKAASFPGKVRCLIWPASGNGDLVGESTGGDSVSLQPSEIFAVFRVR